MRTGPRSKKECRCFVSRRLHPNFPPLRSIKNSQIHFAFSSSRKSRKRCSLYDTSLQGVSQCFVARGNTVQTAPRQNGRRGANPNRNRSRRCTTSQIVRGSKTPSTLRAIHESWNPGSRRQASLLYVILLTRMSGKITASAPPPVKRVLRK